MSVEPGISYRIAEEVKANFNFADTLTIIRSNGVTVQFILDNDKGSGAMPIQHLQYLLRRDVLIPSKMTEEDEEIIG